MVGLVCTALVYWCGSTIEEAQSMEAVGMVGPPTQTLRQQSEEEPPCFHRKSKKTNKTIKMQKKYETKQVDSQGVVKCKVRIDWKGSTADGMD